MAGNLSKSAIALAVLPVAMLVTNPNKQAYTDYASNRFVNEAAEAICKKSEECKNWVDKIKFLPKAVINPMIDAATKRHNLVFFSIYTTEVPGAKFKTIGAFGNFITLSKN
ncbi:MAG: DUF4359 domain-containing protein [Xenococcaceae cyanobacterium]